MIFLVASDGLYYSHIQAYIQHFTVLIIIFVYSAIHESSRTKCPVLGLQKYSATIYYHMLKQTIWFQLNLPSFAGIRTRVLDHNQNLTI